jgi:hypothetical protein
MQERKGLSMKETLTILFFVSFDPYLAYFLFDFCGSSTTGPSGPVIRISIYHFST